MKKVFKEIYFSSYWDAYEVMQILEEEKNWRPLWLRDDEITLKKGNKFLTLVVDKF